METISWWGLLILAVLLFMHWHMSIIVHSLVLHRFATHEQFIFTKKIYIKIAYILLFLILGPSYLSARAYAIMHTLHHRYADTHRDPHKPHKGFLGVITTLYKTSRVYSDIYHQKPVMHIDGVAIGIGQEYFVPRVMDWPSFDAYAHHPITRIAWGVLYGVGYYMILVYFQLPLWLMPLVVVHILMSPIHGALVNYYAHLYGDQPHSMQNTSRNIPQYMQWILMLYGELNHNNHHRYPHSPDFSLGKGVDGGFIVLKVLRYLGIIQFVNK
ncbi:MAG: fatty acid desaturase [Candidatus Pacebacteria bacterium]|nr:fatty acid desaturase [Candidatus Paceibacterota bacterium]MCD8508320.1 fatty acid desaturase [Candidatus Paceibacterota bacterium]MCD8528054.1 fatty acid desaturase [Candidatus Paceibacterota bacterium]MCD8564058.1 fatty acid desaturase [Candidatus Paceibacterota bacterium]